MDVTRPKMSYWVVAVLGLVWNLMGCMNYITQSNPSAVAQMPEAYQALIATRPVWATAAFGIGVFGGAVGCILLLLRRSVAVSALLLSVFGIAVTMLHAMLATALSMQVLLGTGTSVLVGLVLLWVARAAKGKGWLI